MNRDGNLMALMKYLKLSLSEVPDDVIMLILLVQLSRIAMLHRLTVENETKPHLVCVYGINFMPSGTGKDKTMSIINELLMPPYFERYKELEEAYKDRVLMDLKAKAKEIYNDKEGKINKYIKDNYPRNLIDVFFDSTMEGFIAQREEFERAGFGGTLINISEFSDFILSDLSNRNALLSLMKEVYETGDSGSKVTKYEKTANAVKGVPSSALLQSSPNGLINDEAGNKKIMDFLSRGVARRSLICYPEISDNVSDISYSQHLKILDKIKEDRIEAVNIVHRMVNVKDTFFKNEEFIFKFDDRARKRLFSYTQKCTKYYKNRPEALQAEISSRPRKVEKIAGLIALIEHPSVHMVTLTDVEDAMDIVAAFGKYIDKFIANNSLDPVEKLYRHFLENPNIPFRKMDLRKMGFVHKDKFKPWFEEAISEIAAMALIDSYQLRVSQVGSIGTEYILVSASKAWNQ